MSKLVLIFSIFFILYSCGDATKSSFEFAGGTFKMALNNGPSTYVSREIRDIYSSTVLTQVMEGLVSLNPKDLKVQPQLAESWKISPDGLTYEFKLRSDVKFHPHTIFTNEEERILTVEDVKSTIELICKKNAEGLASPGYNLVFEGNLQGVEEYHNGKSLSISGLNVEGDKVMFKLKEKDNNFLNKLAHITCAISSKKIYEANLEHDMIGTGPFEFKEYRQDEINAIILTRNEDYYLTDDEGNSLPYLDGIEFIIENKKLAQLDMFEKHETDFIAGLPTSRITKMLEGRLQDFNSVPPVLILSNNPFLNTSFFLFNLTDERFKNPKVRQAFSYAIDREKIGREVLKNQYYELGYYGIVPPLQDEFRGYDFKGVKENGYTFNPEKARQLLVEAGYPGGKGFGSVNLRFTIDDVQSSLCDEFSKQISQVLGINVNIDGSTFEQTEKDADYAKSEMFRSGWGADYPSPESFLSLFYGKNVPKSKEIPSLYNQSRYVNPEFDKLFEQGKKATKLSSQMNYFSAAEKLLIKDAPFIPLWYKGDYEITYSNVRNFYLNSLNVYNFTYVYKKDWTKEEFAQKAK
jgi:oligopeptide transport system substrate-binding protein